MQDMARTCEGGTIQLTPGTYVADSYVWTSPTYSAPKIGANQVETPTQPTVYYLSMVRGACSQVDSIFLEITSKPVIERIDSLGPRTRAIIVRPDLGTPPFVYGVDDRAVDNDPVKYDLLYSHHIFYVVDAFGCSSNMTDYLLNAPVIFPPSRFTPNGDGIDDTWDIPGLKEYYPDATITIYDRYGKKVAEYKGSAENGWDGKYQGRDMPSTDYWFEINIIEIAKQYVGHFTLLRR